MYSFRDAHGQWDPKNQRPELWNLYNGRIHPGESIRVFPLSNWTELDIWRYIAHESIPVVPLYFAAERDVVRRGGSSPPARSTRLMPGEARREGARSLSLAGVLSVHRGGRVRRAHGWRTSSPSSRRHASRSA